MSNTKRCPQCQAEIPAAAPEGLCPQCLLQAGLQPKTAEAEVKTAPFSPNGSRFEPPTPEALQPAFPQLEILELLGKGGMGAVYKARQPGLDRLVAVKILPPEVSHDPAFAERFTREARALAMLNHPNIIGVYDSGRAGGYYYFVMEYLDGVNLRQAMRAGELTSAEALKIVPQICEALQFAHDEGIVHRDIKPENILLDKKGRVKIADFGLAKLLGRTAADVSLTGTQQVMGTMHYMAPEQLEGSRDVDHRADIYSLGVTFYEMLTGELPIGRFAAPSKKVQIDVRLDEVVLRSLEKEPELRYQHASEIKTDMETIASGPVAAPAGPSTAKLDMPVSVPYAGVIPTGPFDPGAFGMLHFDGVFLEFEITKRGFFSNSRLQSVRIPLAEVKSMWVEQGKPLGWGLPAPRLWSLNLRTNRMRALDDLPFGSQGQVQIFLEPANVAAAHELQKAVSQSLKRYQPGSEIKTEVEGIIRTPDSPADAKETAERIDSQTLAWSLFVMVVLYLLAIYVSGFSVLVIVLGLAACGKVGQELIKMSRKDRASETKTEVEGIVGTPAPAASEAVADELEQLVLKNPYSKPLAIRMFRDKTGASLKDATAAVEAIAQKHGIHPEPSPTPQSIRAERIVLILIVAGMGMAIFIGIFGAVLYKYALSFIVVIGLPIIGAHVFAAIAIFHEWWIRPSAFLAKLWRTSLLIVGALSMLIFLKPIARLGAGLHGADEISVGIWPWLSFFNNDVEPDFQLFASWSLLAFPVGWLAFWAYRQSFVAGNQDLAKEPEQRNQQASEIKTEVEGIVSTPVPPAATASVAEESEKAYADLPPGKKLLVDYYRTRAGFDLNKAMATVSAMDELELAVLENFSDKILSIKTYREKTGASLNDAKAAVEAIAKKHGLEFPLIDWKTNAASAIVDVFALAVILITFEIAAWFCIGLSSIIAVPLVLLLASPFAVSAWKNWGTPAGYRSAVWAGVILFAPVGIPFLVSVLADPEPRLNRLYALTGTTPGPHDALLVQVISWGGIICLLIWLFNWVRTLTAQPTAKKPPQKRFQHASEIKTDKKPIANAAPETATAVPEPTQAAPPAGYLRFVVAPTAAVFGILLVAALILWNVCHIFGGEEQSVGFALGIGLVLWAMMIPVLNAIWFYRAEARAAGAKPARRLWLFQVLGTLMLLWSVSGIFGLMGDFLVELEIPAWLAAQPELESAYRAYRIGNGALSYVLHLAGVAVGIGLVLRLPWGRRGAIALTLIDAARMVMVQAPIDFAFEFQAIPSAPIPANAGSWSVLATQLNVDTYEAREAILIGGFTFLVISTLMLNLAIVFYLTRPHVRKLFGENNAPAVGTAGPGPTQASGIPA